ALLPVIADREPGDVALRDVDVGDRPDPSVDPYVLVAAFVIHEERDARISHEVRVLRAPNLRVEDHLVAIEQVPHDREVWRARTVHRTEHREALLIEVAALVVRERHQRNRSLSAGRT